MGCPQGGRQHADARVVAPGRCGHIEPLDHLGDGQHRFVRAPAGRPRLGKIFLPVEKQSDHRMGAPVVDGEPELPR